jgi:hypothetical protein
MATLVPNLKQKIYEEDVETGAAASEATMTKIAGTINIFADYNFYPIHFDIHGPYNIIGVPDNKVDKFYLVPYNCEIVACHFYTGENVGSSGSVEVDVIKKPLVGSETSIFSTRPVIPASAGTEADTIQEFLPVATNIRLATGGTAPVLVSTQLDQYDVLKFNIISKPVGTLDKMGLVLLIRPR